MVAATDISGPSRDIPRAWTLPLVGNTLDMAKDPAQFFLKAYRKHGPVFRAKVLGNEYVVIAGNEAANFMNTRDGKESLRSKEFWEGLVKEYKATCTLTGEDGEKHSQLRSVMKRGYSRESIKGRFNEFIETTDKAIDRDWKPGKLPSVVQAMQYLVTEQLGMLLTGHAPLEYVSDIRTTILYILNVLVTRQRPKFMLLNPEYKKAKARVFELGHKMIEDYNRSKGTKTDEQKNLIDDIMEAHEKNPTLIPDSDLIITLTGPYVAGLDTVANTTAACLYTILKHPEVKARVIAEADAYYGNGPLQDEDLKGLTATQGAIMETMRLYPIAVAQMRTATKDFEFQGYIIPKDQLLFVATSVPHFMEEFFPNPTKFDIDRYERPRAEHLAAGAYSPYGRGPHTCLGKSLAEVQMLLMMSRLFYKLDMTLDPPDYELKTKTAPTPGPVMNFGIKINGIRH